MDIFVEQLVKKKREPVDYLIVVVCIVLALVLVYVLSSTLFTLIGFAMIIIVAVIIYALYLLVTSINLEYEYCFTNGALDVDKIINVRKRKRMTELNAREIDVMASSSHPDYEKYLKNPAFKKIYACEDRHGDGLCFVVYNENGEQKMLLFTPNEKIKDGFKKFNPQKVELSI